MNIFTVDVVLALVVGAVCIVKLLTDGLQPKSLPEVKVTFPRSASFSYLTDWDGELCRFVFSDGSWTDGTISDVDEELKWVEITLPAEASVDPGDEYESPVINHEINREYAAILFLSNVRTVFRLKAAESAISA